MRNFWFEANIDGKKTLVKGGPRGREGGMVIELYVRSKGNSVEVLTINCVEIQGTLHTIVNDSSGEKVFSVVTQR